MKSTDHNLNNPLKTVDIELLRTVESYHMPNIEAVSQEEYDLIQIHDPNTIFYITNSKDGRFYIGDMLIIPDNTINKYYLNIDTNKKYVIYVDENAGKTFASQYLIPICSYDDPQVAINELTKFNKVGSHIDRDFDIYNIIASYINKDISTHEFIISIMIVFNYREDPRLQNVIQFCMGHNANRCMKEFPAFYSELLPIMRDNQPKTLFPLYSNLYDLIVKYNFFTDKKYSNEDVNLSKEISDIYETMMFKR